MATTFNNILAASSSEQNILSIPPSPPPPSSSSRMRQESFGHSRSSLTSSTMARQWSQWTRDNNQKLQMWLLLLLIVVVIVFGFAILMTLAAIKSDLKFREEELGTKIQTSALVTNGDEDEEDDLPGEENHGSLNFLCDEDPADQRPPQKFSGSPNFTWIKCGRSSINDCATTENTLKVNGKIVCRGMKNGQLAIGQFSNLTNSCEVPYGWSVHVLRTAESEVLVASPNSYKWVPSSNGIRVDNALPAGMIRGGEVMHIGRCEQAGTLVAGKVAPSHHCLFVGNNGKEFCCKSYQVLVALSKMDVLTAFNQMKRLCPTQNGG